MIRQSTIIIDQQKCHTCTKCQAVKSCRVRAIVQIEPGEPPYLDYERCFDCRACIIACPYHAITILP